MATQISIKKGGSDPTSSSGLTLAEPVFITANNTLWIGKGSGITAVWVGAGICGASSGIAAGLTYQIPTAAAVKNYVASTSITSYVSSFNGATGAVTGASLGTNVFTGLNSFNAGICASGITLSSGIITAPGAGVYLTSSNTKNAKINLLGGPSSSQVELDAITVRVRNTTDSALPTFELYEATDVYSAKMQYTSSATNDATITFPAITGTVALTNQVVTSVNGQTGAVTIAAGGDVVSSFNGLTGAVQGVSAAIAGTGISVSGATGAVTITNTGVQSFNGATGAVTGASLGANTFTGTQTLTAGLTTSYLYASTGSTFGSTLQVNGGATFSGRTDFAGSNNFATGLTASGTLTTTSNIKFNGTTAKTISTQQAPLTISGITSGASTGNNNSIVFGVQTTTPLTFNSTTGTFVFTTTTAGENPSNTSLTLVTDDANVYGPQTVTIGPATHLTASRTLTVPDDSGTIALTKNVVSSFNGLTGAVGGVCAAQANTFTALQSFTTGISAAGGITFNGPVTGATATFTGLLTASGGISASGGMTLDGGKVWHSQNDGATSGLDAGALYGISGGLYASSLSTGLLYGGLVTINAGNSAAFDFTAGVGYIVSTGASYTAQPEPVITRVSWTAKTGVTLSGLTAQDTTWLYIDSSGNLQQQASYYTDNQIQSTIAIGALIHPSRSYITLARTIPNVSYATDKQYEQFIRAFGPLKVSGHTISANGANLKLDRSTGSAFILGRNYVNNPDDPSVVTDIAKTDCTFFRYYRGATAGTFVTVTGATAIDPANYDDGSGTLQSVPGGKYTIQRLFYYPNTPDVLGVYYGRAQYISMSEAVANLNIEAFSENENSRTNAVFVAYLVVKSGASSLTNANDALLLQAGNFRSTVASGGSTVTTNLDSLSDVIINGVTNDHVLTYVDGTTGWQNIAVSSLISKYGVTSFNGVTGAVTGLSPSTANTFTALQTFTGGISASGGITFSSNISAPNIVYSFNGSTGAVQGVGTFNGLTGAVGITAGSNITITQSGNTYTISAAAASSGATATYSVTTSTNANATRYLTFVTGACANGTSLLVDDVTTPLSYTPFTGTLNTKNINLVAAADTLSITPVQISAGQDFYFTSNLGGIYFESPNLVQLGDIAQAVNGTILNINPVAYEGVLYNIAGGDAFMGINRDGTSNSFAVEANSSTGNALQLIYNTVNGAATTKADFTVSSAGVLGVAPSGGTLAVTGNLTANNLVYSFNGSTGAVTGVSRVNGLSGGITLAAGTGITLTASGNTITIASTLGTSNSTTQTLDFSETINGLEIVFSGSGGDFGTLLSYVENYKTITAIIESGGAQYSVVLDTIQSFYDPTNGWSARLVAKAPFVDTSTLGVNTAQAIVDDTITTIYLDLTSSSGLNIVDYWTTINSTTVYHQEETYAVKTVTGQTWVTADSYITCKVLGITTADHTPEDAILEGVQFEINNIVVGTGFDIIGHAPEGTYGKYTVKCIEQ